MRYGIRAISMNFRKSETYLDAFSAALPVFVDFADPILLVNRILPKESPLMFEKD